MSVLSDKALPLIKQRLNRNDTRLDVYLKVIAESAELELKRKGIYLQDDVDDLMILVDYAVWRYQNRDQTGTMPLWLKTRLKERWISFKGRDPDDT